MNIAVMRACLLARNHHALRGAIGEEEKRMMFAPYLLIVLWWRTRRT